MTSGRAGNCVHGRVQTPASFQRTLALYHMPLRCPAGAVGVHDKAREAWLMQDREGLNLHFRQVSLVLPAPGL